jgi:hypothetical protein
MMKTEVDGAIDQREIVEVADGDLVDIALHLNHHIPDYYQCRGN